MAEGFLRLCRLRALIHPRTRAPTQRPIHTEAGVHHVVLPASQRVAMPRDRDRTEPAALRAKIRTNDFTGQTSGHAAGFVQANFCALPKEHAFDFLAFCLRNPRPCPLLEVLEPGDPEPRNVAPGADVSTDIPRYRVYRHGQLVDELDNISALYTGDMVGFLLGCSFSWEAELAAAGLVPRHMELNSNVPMFVTDRANAAAGAFRGKLVVSMRPYLPEQVGRVSLLTAQYPLAHGAPIFSGDPRGLGIAPSHDWSMRPDFGDGVPLLDGEIGVFWACGVTPQTAIMEAKLPLAITHAPGHMFVTDLWTGETRLPSSPTEPGKGFALR